MEPKQKELILKAVVVILVSLGILNTIGYFQDFVLLSVSHIEDPTRVNYLSWLVDGLAYLLMGIDAIISAVFLLGLSIQYDKLNE